MTGPGRARAAALRSVLAAEGLATMLVTNPTNIAWLSGFQGSNGIVVCDDSVMTLCTDGRYATQAPAQAAAHGADVAVVVDADIVNAAAELAGSGPIGLEAEHITWAVKRRLADAGAAELRATTDLVEALRALKDAQEITCIRRAAAIADAALESVLHLAGTQCSERSLALALDDAIRSGGGSGPAYETIVASGPNAALPHARPTDRIIEPGDLVIIDVGCLFEGYRSDMTRTFVVGEPDDRQRHLLTAVLAAQQAGVAAVSAGVEARSVDAACRASLAAEELSEYFVHGTGHGVGLDIHERPAVNSRTDDVLDADMVVTVEPGVYIEGVGGVRWEDLLLVTPSGAEVLTVSPKPFSIPVR